MAAEELEYGRYAGAPWTRIPVGYLRWMVNVRHAQAESARRELERRGTTFPDLELSGHAIDRVSQRMLDEWQRRRRGDEGLNSWLHRTARDALDRGHDLGRGRHEWEGAIYVFAMDNEWPVLMTVLPRRSKPR